MKSNPSNYEIQAMKEIQNYKNPSGLMMKFGKAINLPFSKAAEVAMKIPGVDWVINKTFVGLISLLNDVAHWSVRKNSIYEEFTKSGYDIQNNSDLYKLDLQEIDKIIGLLDTKYKAMAAIEGAATGFWGLPGIPPDILTIITYNLRAIGEYATYYGIEILLQQERLYAMNILGLASSPTDAAKQAALGQLAKIAADTAAKKTWEKLNDYMFVKIVQQIAETLGVRLTKAKLAEIIPGVGAFIGGGFNIYFTNKVCNAAYFLYRERFLVEKYGPDILNVTNDQIPTIKQKNHYNVSSS